MTITRASGVVNFQFPINNGSDRALKRNITPITDALAKVRQLQGVAFDRIGSDLREIGLIAQDVQGVVPEVVREIPAMVLPDGASDEARALHGVPRLGITYSQLTALLIEAVKELTERVAVLEGSEPSKPKRRRW
jgi:hypothetical protein